MTGLGKKTNHHFATTSAIVKERLSMKTKILGEMLWEQDIHMVSKCAPKIINYKKKRVLLQGQSTIYHFNEVISFSISHNRTNWLLSFPDMM